MHVSIISRRGSNDARRQGGQVVQCGDLHWHALVQHPQQHRLEGVQRGRVFHGELQNGLDRPGRRLALRNALENSVHRLSSANRRRHWPVGLWRLRSGRRRRRGRGGGGGGDGAGELVVQGLVDVLERGEDIGDHGRGEGERSKDGAHVVASLGHVCTRRWLERARNVAKQKRRTDDQVGERGGDVLAGLHQGCLGQRRLDLWQQR